MQVGVIYLADDCCVHAAGGQGPGVEFAVEYEHRASDQFDRLEVINKFVEPIPKPPNKVNLSKPEKTLVVQVGALGGWPGLQLYTWLIRYCLA